MACLFLGVFQKKVRFRTLLSPSDFLNLYLFFCCFFIIFNIIVGLKCLKLGNLFVLEALGIAFSVLILLPFQATEKKNGGEFNL